MSFHSLAPSIGRRLIVFLVAPAAAILIAGTGIDYFTSIAPVRHAYDQALIDAAMVVAGHLRVNAAGKVVADLPPPAEAILRTDAVDSVYFRVSGGDGSYIAGDADLPRPSPAAANPALYDVSYRGQPIRLVRYHTETAAGAADVVVAETTHKRQALRVQLLSTATAVDLIELGAILALGWLGMKIAFRPLHALSVLIGKRSARDLDPIDAGRVPVEVRPLVSALNGLLVRVNASSQSQREFLENAAHQLGTPLAGIQAQLQVLLAEPATASMKTRLDPVLGATQRLARTTHQLLALARSGEAANLQDNFTTMDLKTAVAFVVENHLGQAVAAGVELEAEAAAAEITGIPWLIEELLSNLIDNAIAHTPAGGTVTARCGHDVGAQFLEVVDTGIGIPPEDRARVTARFIRGKSARRHGSGLGLAIVAEIANLHEAHLEISAGPDGRGTAVHIAFPRWSPQRSL